MSQKCFLLVNLFTSSFKNDHIMKQAFAGKKIIHSFTHLTLYLFNFSLQTCSYRSTEKNCDETWIFYGQRIQITAMVMSSIMSY